MRGIKGGVAISSGRGVVSSSCDCCCEGGSEDGAGDSESTAIAAGGGGVDDRGGEADIALSAGDVVSLGKETGVVGKIDAQQKWRSGDVRRIFRVWDQG